MADRISTLDVSYKTGQLSIYPDGLDSRQTLYEVRNNAETVLTQALSYSGSFIVVDDGSKFPPQGLVTVGTEIIYYNQRTDTVFRDLKRGFAGSRQNVWPMATKVSNAVMAETHNAIKDAIINIESNIGKAGPTANPVSLNGILNSLETRFLAPKPLFRAFPILGAPPLSVRFQNFSGGEPIRFLWDFGDGTTSVTINPIHTYKNEGVYSVKLSMITSLGAQGVVTKTNYITIDGNAKLPLFYVTPLSGVSVKTGTSLSVSSTTFNFVDQTDGDIVSRYWIWDDTTNLIIDDPDVHSASHVYELPGEYSPSLLVVFSNTTLKRVLLNDKIIVT